VSCTAANVREELVRVADQCTDPGKRREPRRGSGALGTVHQLAFAPGTKGYSRHPETRYAAHLCRTSYLPDDLPLLPQGNRASYRWLYHKLLSTLVPLRALVTRSISELAITDSHQETRTNAALDAFLAERDQFV
jgi:hypothetical protein